MIALLGIGSPIEMAPKTEPVSDEKGDSAKSDDGDAKEEAAENEGDNI